MEDNPFFHEPTPAGNEETMEVSREALDRELAMAKKELLSDLVDKNKKQSDPLERLKNIVSQYKQTATESKELYEAKQNLQKPLTPFPSIGATTPPSPPAIHYPNITPASPVKPFIPSSLLPPNTPPLPQSPSSAPKSPFPPFDYKNKNTPSP